MKIPEKTKILGRLIETVFDPKLVFEDDDSGQSRYREEKIIIQPSLEGSPRKQENIEVTYLHEIIHWILYLLGETELFDKEGFVRRLTEAFYQVLHDNELRF